jgi:hypothetical protein
MSKRPFSNGTEYHCFLDACCERCSKGDDYRNQTPYAEDREASCEIEEALSVSCVTDGEISDEMYARLFGPLVGHKDEVHGPLCAEFEPMDWDTAKSAAAFFQTRGLTVPKQIREFAPHKETP